MAEWRINSLRPATAIFPSRRPMLLALYEALTCGYAVPRARSMRRLKFVDNCGRADGMFMYRLNGTSTVLPHSGGRGRRHGVWRSENWTIRFCLRLRH